MPRTLSICMTLLSAFTFAWLGANVSGQLAEKFVRNEKAGAYDTTNSPSQAATSDSYAEAMRKGIPLIQAAVQHEIAAKDIPAFSIALVDEYGICYEQGFCHPDKKEQATVTSHSVYRVGSISKLFTDIALLQLLPDVDALDRPVRDVLPGFLAGNREAETITLRQLASHRSGLVREPPIGHYFDPNEPTLKATVESLNRTQLTYPPSTRTKYSNAGIAVIGQAVEALSGDSHPDYVLHQIFEKLQMTESDFQFTERVRSKFVKGWMRTYDGRRFEAPNFLLGTGPAGNMYSSAHDLGLFLNHLFKLSTEPTRPTESILSKDKWESMLTPQLDSEGKPNAFAIGFNIQDFDGHRKIGHGGAVYGFSTQLEAIPDQKVGVAAIAAVDGANGVVSRLCQFALRVTLAARNGQPLPHYQMTDSIPKEIAVKLVGDYVPFEDTDPKTFVRISELAGKVYLRRGAYEFELRYDPSSSSYVTDDLLGFGTKVEWISPSPNETSAKTEPTNASSRKDSEFELRIGGKSYRRDSRSIPSAPSREIQGLIGEYGWEHDVLYILEDRGELYALIEWFDYYPLSKITDDVYAFPNYGLYHGEKLIFHRDENGDATHVIAAEVQFDRRNILGERGGFRMEPVRPISELRQEALRASPPAENAPIRPSDLVELIKLDPSLRLDIRYASTNNFAGSQFYTQARAFLQRPAAEALVRANKQLAEFDLAIVVYDAYRPWSVTKMFWDATPDRYKQFVANPAKGSRHNRGCAADIGLYRISTNEIIELVSGYDEFTPRAFPRYPGGTDQQRYLRELLRSVMQSEGFDVYEFEWWHFDYRLWRDYAIGNQSFEELQIKN